MMQSGNKNDLSKTITVSRSPQEAFEAITNVRGWWSQAVEGVTDELGAEFDYHFKDVHRCRVRITELVPGQKVAWLILDNHFNFVSDQGEEWKGTQVVFDISPKDGGAEVRFTHVGLLPEHECYDVCANAWVGYIDGSLRDLINTGVGQPNPREDDSLPEHQSAATTVRAAKTSPAPGSILLGTTQPEQLRDWYGKALARDYAGSGPIMLGSFMLIIEQRDDVSPTNNEPGRMILNFHVPDFDAVEAQLRSAGVEWLTPVEDRPGDRFGTFADPDGNYLQIIQLKQNPAAHT